MMQNQIISTQPAAGATPQLILNGPRKGGKRARVKYHPDPLSCKVEPVHFFRFLDLAEGNGQSRCEYLRNLVLRELGSHEESSVSSLRRPVSHLRRAIEAFELAVADGEIDANEVRRVLGFLHMFEHEGIFTRKARR